MKKVFASLVSMVLSLSLAVLPAMGAVAKEETVTAKADAGVIDEEVPVLNSVEFWVNGRVVPDGQVTINAGDSVDIVVEASDNGEISYIGIDFFAPDKGHMMSGYSGFRYDNNDNKWHGILETYEYDYGKFLIESIDIRDMAGNRVKYVNDECDHWDSETLTLPLPEPFSGYQVVINNSKEIDDTPPELVDIQLIGNTVNAPGQVEVKVKIEENGSGMDKYGYINVFFEPKADKEYSTGLKGVSFVLGNDGYWHSKIEIPKYGFSEYYLDSIYLVDNASNVITLYNPKYNVDSDVETFDVKFQDITINVRGNVLDKTPPAIKSIDFNGKPQLEVDVPAVIFGTMEVIEEGSGVASLYGGYGEDIEFWFKNGDNEDSGYFSNYYIIEHDIGKPYSIWEIKYYDDGKYHFEWNVNQYAKLGKYYLDRIRLEDKVGNSVDYYNPDLIKSGYGTPNGTPLPEIYRDYYIEIKNTNSGSATTGSLGDKEGLIKNIKEEAAKSITVPFDSNPKISEDIFTALAESDKTVRFVDDGVVWEFEGSKVDPQKAKAIDLSVTHSYKEDNSLDGAEDIKSITQGANAVVLKFAENGELPGPAKIKIKTDYALREYLGQSIYLYYYDQTNRRFEEIDGPLKIDRNTNYVEFTINHCSQYVLTNKKLTKLTPDKNGNTYYPSGGSRPSTTPDKTPEKTPDDTTDKPDSGLDDMEPAKPKVRKIYRFFNPRNGHHLYTINEVERLNLINAGWQEEGSFDILAEKTEGAKDVYRMFNKVTGEHLYTASVAEREMIENHGWKYEGIAFISGGEKDMYRLYNQKTGRHHFTASMKERELLENNGWICEGIAFKIP